MKLSISIITFREGVLRAAGTIKNSSTLPILSNLLLEAASGQLTITATNLDQFLQLSLPCEVSEPGSITLAAVRLVAVAKAAIGTEMTLETDKELRGVLRAGSGMWKLAGLAATEFPAVPVLEKAKEWTMPQDQMRAALARVQHAQSSDSTRYVLNGVLLEVVKKNAAWVATDGRRMALVEQELDAPDCKEIIPSECVRQMLRLLGSEGDVRMRFSHEWLSMEANGVTLFSKFIAETFASYRQVIPNAKEALGNVALPREDTINLLRRVMAVGVSDITPSVKLSFSKNNLRIEGRNGVTAEGSDEIGVKCERDFTIALNAAFVEQLLSPLSEDEVAMTWIDELAPAMFKAKDFTGVIMPMRVQA